MQLFSGVQYLKIDIANNFGLDKKNWDQRLQWFDDNEDKLEALLSQAEEPALYYAGVKAYRDHQGGKSCHYPISLDATSSGLQILACLTGDRKASSICNVIDTGKREDAYTAIYEAMLSTTGGEAKIERKQTKQAVMTSLYGSEAVPKSVFGEGALLALFEQTMDEQAPGAWELNKQMLALWDPEAYAYHWVMPDNFNVHVKVMQMMSENVHFLDKPYEVSFAVNEPMEKGRSLGANMTHSIDGMIVREMTRRCMYDTAKIEMISLILDPNYKQARRMDTDDKSRMVRTLWGHYLDSGFLSARILDYLTGDNIHLVDKLAIFDLVASLPKNPFQVIAVHDCFRCLPNYGNDLRKQYNILLAGIAKSRLLSFLLTQITGRKMEVGKLDPDLWKDVLDADYALS
ncbi:RNAP2-like RNA polymerase protein [Rhizobium phage RHph_Y2_6]|uniref:DNA-directed RNA polymerase n=1 Tax=Rhizobium phage RHph_Y2_6 TaxID=2509576 RepID=A0A7S5RB52_9CAUD|nr:RNAP2-like RNA polymerase protein [Rhizobium phage RHph_Y2_6]QIG68774.1 RNAP2-like RNA polymerase protein [Rhizobium phage RHph_Y2_6]